MNLRVSFDVVRISLQALGLIYQNSWYRYNFYILCRVIYSTIGKGVLHDIGKDNAAAHQLKTWTVMFKILEDMVDITQKYTGRPYLAAMLKVS